MPDNDWTNSITDFAPNVDPNELIAHPLNARLHPTNQRSALRGSLNRVGWVDAVKVNQRTGRIVDGHARVEEAVAAGTSVPVLWLDLDEEDERFVLATIDPISALATYDGEVLHDLLGSITVADADVSAMLADLAAGHAGPGEAPSLDDLDDNHDPEIFWPTVKVKIDPETHDSWQAYVFTHDGDEQAAFRALLER
jgi:hypothetical protein